MSAAVGASSCSAAIAAWSWKGPTTAVARVAEINAVPSAMRRGIPAATVLQSERYERTVGPRPGRAAGIGQHHQREQASDFAVLGNPAV